MPRAGLSRAGVVGIALTVVDDGGLRGYEDLTLAAVAARAGVATPSLYKHVGSLDHLRQEVAIVCIDELTAHLTDAALGRSGGDALRRVATAYRAFALERPGRYAATQAAPPPAPQTAGQGAGQAAPPPAAQAAPARDAAGRLAASAARAVAVVAATLHGCGVPPGRTVDAARAVRSALHGFVSLELAGGFALPDDVGESFDFLVRTLENGIRDATRDDGHGKAGPPATSDTGPHAQPV